jgi:serine protease Do
MQSMKRRFVWPLVAAVAIAGGSFFGAAELSRPMPAFGQNQAQTAKPTQTPQSSAVAPASDLSRAFRTVHDALKDAVVNINVTKKPVAMGNGRGNGNMRMQIPQQFRDMLPPGVDPDQIVPFDQNPDRVIEGTGSGIIVSADGYILTNNHVVSDVDEVSVTLNDGRELKAEVVGTDPKTDLAVIRVKADHLTYAKFGNSDDLQVGDWVLAFGSPFGFSQTMTQGIISAKGRHVPIIAEHNQALQGMTYENFLQTDAAINPGNSGGPLVNLQGEVVGINAAIASNTGAYNGIGFSIPSNDAQYIMHSLIEHGKVVRGYLGVMIEDANHPAAEDKGLLDSLKSSGFNGKGIFVKSVTDKSPAAASGIQPGDVITGINGKSETDVDELRNQIARTPPDTKLNLNIWRDGQTENVSVELGTQPEGRMVAQAAPSRSRNQAQPNDLGVRVQDMTPAYARRNNLSGTTGAIITNVDPQSIAAGAGLEPGDVVTKVDKTDVTSAKQFDDVLSKAKLSDGVKLLVRGDDGSQRMVFVQKQ